MLCVIDMVTITMENSSIIRNWDIKNGNTLSSQSSTMFKDLKMILTIMTIYILIISCTVPTVEAQQQDPLIYVITEGSGQQSDIVADLVQDYKLDEKYNQGQINNLSFVFIENEQGLSDLFVSPITGGLLLVKSPIDRDNICPNMESCVIHLDIKIQPSQYFEIIKIQVVVEDINDNEPVFDMLIEELDVSESAPIGTMLVLPQAIDLDSPAYGIQLYEIEPSSDTFRILQDTSTGTRTVQLEILKQLDREKNDLYTFQMIAFDGGSPAQTSIVEIRINVLDSNDNSPVFVRDNIIVSVNETIPVGSSVLKVTAQDKDTGINGVVTYSFDVLTDGDLFRVDETTGTIYIKSQLDYETESQHVLTILAKDNNPDYPGTAARVTINVLDINDNRPSIKINDYIEGDSIVIPENSPSDFFVAHLTVNDLDSNNNGLFDCSINGTNIKDDFQLERLYSTDFKITTSKSFDREIKDQYKLQITCQDNGSPSLYSRKEIPIRVSDVNDVQPKFSTNTFVGNALESKTIGSYIMKISATDSDLGINGEVEYYIENSDTDERDYNTEFSVGFHSGNITLRAALDRELEDRVEFKVIAVDKGNPALTSTATVIIDVVDVDDNIPRFNKENTELSVLEDELPSTDVGQVIANDADSDNFNQFTYDIEQNDFFTIDPYSGMIYTKVKIDREVNPGFSLRVYAVSSIFNPTTSTASVTIDVKDKNDHHPVIHFPNPQNNTVHISNTLTRGEIVTFIQANDLDKDRNSMLTYSVIGGNSDEFFIMDSSIGAVMVHKSLTGINLRSFGLIIKVRDNGLPPLFAETYLNIVVNKSITSAHEEILETKNLSIAISIACISGLIIVILMVAIAMILRQRAANSKSRMYNYAPKVLDRNIFLNKSKQNDKQQKTSSSSIDSVFPAVGDKSNESSSQGFTNLGLDSTDSQLHEKIVELPCNHAHHNNTNQDADSDTGCSDADTDSGRGSNEDSHEQIKHAADQYNQNHQYNVHNQQYRQQHPDVISATKQTNPLYGVPQRHTSLSWQQQKDQLSTKQNSSISTKQLPVGTSYNNNHNTSRDSGNHSHLVHDNYNSDTRLELGTDHLYRDNRRRDLLYRDHISTPKTSSSVANRSSDSDISSDRYLQLSGASRKPGVLHEVHV